MVHPGRALRVGSCGRVDDEWFEFAVLDPETDQILGVGEVGQFAVRPRRPWVLMQGYMGMPEKTVEAWRTRGSTLAIWDGSTSLATPTLPTGHRIGYGDARKTFLPTTSRSPP